ncbi:S8 family peptidase [Zooshikella harenae]|uniref:S8 family peptidase n=1 Tax=Zooshikella harenae TaxID=2827238 RepID=A0ABS5Z9H3_9GAMM|nr:S8 family peptidase [Zooshikella harenae]MBU2710706.1 S8 family peptidase [Zooshikella harenae]
MNVKQYMVSAVVVSALTFTQGTLLYAGNTTEATPPPANSISTVESAQTTNRLIMRFNKAHISLPVKEVLAQLSNRISIQMTYVRTMGTGDIVFKLPSFQNTQQIQQLVDQLQQQPEVEYVEPDWMMQPKVPMSITPTDPLFNQQWSLLSDQYFGSINVQQAWQQNQGQGVVVAVLDSGYLPHQDLKENLLSGYDMVSDPVMANDGDGRDNNPLDPGDAHLAGECSQFGTQPIAQDTLSSWHGTQIAGVIAAAANNIGISGIAHQAKILPVRTVGKCGGYTSDLVDGIRWAAGLTVANVPLNEHPAQIITISSSEPGKCKASLQQAIDKANQKGITIIVAAGNNGDQANHYSPGNCQNVIAVTASDFDGKLTDYSNRGEGVTVAAPGGVKEPLHAGILSTSNTGYRNAASDSYQYAAGTGLAAAHVAGVAAILYSLQPTITPIEIKQLITSTAQKQPKCSECGHGVIDAGAAVNKAMKYKYRFFSY